MKFFTYRNVRILLSYLFVEVSRPNSYNEDTDGPVNLLFSFDVSIHHAAALLARAMDRLSLPPGNLRPYCAVVRVGVVALTSPLMPGLESKALLIFEVKGLLPSLPFPFFSYWWFESLWVLRLQGARWGALPSILLPHAFYGGGITP